MRCFVSAGPCVATLTHGSGFRGPGKRAGKTMHTHARTTTEHRAGRRSTAASQVEDTGATYLFALEFNDFVTQDFTLQLDDLFCFAANSMFVYFDFRNVRKISRFHCIDNLLSIPYFGFRYAYCLDVWLPVWVLN